MKKSVFLNYWRWLRDNARWSSGVVTLYSLCGRTPIRPATLDRAFLTDMLYYGVLIRVGAYVRLSAYAMEQLSSMPDVTKLYIGG